MSDLLGGPWTFVSVDFAEVYGSCMLANNDEYSKFSVVGIHVHVIPSLSADTFIFRIYKIFSEIGNLPFSSLTVAHQRKGFELFSADLGFKQRKITPYWPQTNSDSTVS